MKFFLSLFISIVLFGCNGNGRNNSNSKLEDFIPKQSELIISISNFEYFKTAIKQNSFLRSLTKFEQYFPIANTIANINVLDIQPRVFICFQNDSITPYYSVIGTLNANASAIKQDSLHYVTRDRVFMISNSKHHAQEFKIQNDATLTSYTKVIDSNALFSVIIPNTSSNAFETVFTDNTIANGSGTSTLLNFNFSNDSVSLDGVYFTKSNAIDNLLNAFKNTAAKKNSFQNITPINAKGFLSFTSDNFKPIQQGLKPYQNYAKDSLSIVTNTLFESVNELGELYLNNATVVALKSTNPQATQEALFRHETTKTTYKGISIYDYRKKDISFKAFNPLITTLSASKYAVLDDIFICSNSEASLKTVISNYQNGTVLSKWNAFEHSFTQLNEASSLLVVAKRIKLQGVIERLFKVTFSASAFSDYNLNIFQFVSDNTLIHINGLMTKAVASQTSKTEFKELFSTTIGYAVAMSPHFVTNHNTKRSEIVVQDINNNLYLISNNGKILWKKQLNGSILGSVQQIDLYKNNKLQFAFATPKRVYIVDRNGKDVTPFPLRFNDLITQPLSIFDYDSNKNYRFLVTQNDAILMYNSKGKTVSGFSYKTANPITTTPKHFRIKGKDYIVFAAGTTMKILDRQGKDRIIVEQNINFSQNAIFNYNNHFTTLSLSNELVNVSLNGTVTKQNLSLDGITHLDINNNTLVTLTDNVLSINNTPTTLNYGTYSAPKIVSLNNKSYISTTNLETQKVFVFDDKSKLMPSFPLYGGTAISLANTKDKLQLVTKADRHTIVVYEQNKTAK